MKKRQSIELHELSLTNDHSPQIFTANTSSPQECLEFYKRFQILHYRLSNDQRINCPFMSTPLNGLKAVWNVEKEIIATQWKIENYCGIPDDSLTAEQIIMGKGIAERSHPFYASCVIESRRDEDDHTNEYTKSDENNLAIADTLLNGYIQHPPFAKWNRFRYDDTIWVFVGKNVTSNSDYLMQGRTEHTDFVDHTGAWHFQVSGRKIWRCRPVDESPEWGHRGAPAVSECCSYGTSDGAGNPRDSCSCDDRYVCMYECIYDNSYVCTIYMYARS